MQKIIFNKSDTVKTIFKLFLLGLFCFLTVAFFMCITAFVIAKINFSYEILSIVTAAILAASAFFDGYVVSKLFKENGLILGAFAGLIIFILLVFFSVYYNSISVSVSFITKAATVIFAGAIGGIIGVNTN